MKSVCCGSIMIFILLKFTNNANNKISPLYNTVILLFHSGCSSPVEKVLCHSD
jgi:hypothetical protein